MTHHSIHPRLYLHWHRQQRGHFCFISKCPPLIASPNPVEQIKKFAAFCLLAFHFVSSAADCSDRSSPRDLVVDKEALQSERMRLRSAALHFWTESKCDFRRVLFSPLYIHRLLIFLMYNNYHRKKQPSLEQKYVEFSSKMHYGSLFLSRKQTSDVCLAPSVCCVNN